MSATVSSPSPPPTPRDGESQVTRLATSGTLKAATALVLSLWAAGTAWLSYLLIPYPATPGPGPDREIALQVPDGADGRAVSQLLAAHGAIDDAFHFLAYMCLRGACDRLYRGAISVNPSLTPFDQLARVARMPAQTAHVRVMLPEGLDRFAIAERIERVGACTAPDFIAATEDIELLQQLGVPAASAEGYLFPDTYELTYRGDAARIVRTLVQTHFRRTRPLWERHSAHVQALRARLGWDRHAFLTLASIVEKEAQRPQERRVIAGVFMNRLLDPSFRPKRLQADPTVGYGCLVAPQAAKTCALYDGRRILPAMLRDPDNAYNTYRHEGLPPGPIANPGLGALEAALSPAEHGYFYFVARGDGSHTFSATLDEHNAAIRVGRESP